jgi:hypothetical protein
MLLIKERTSAIWKHFFPSSAHATDTEANVTAWKKFLKSKEVDGSNAVVDDCLLLSMAVNFRIDFLILETSEPLLAYSVREKYKEAPLLKKFLSEIEWSKYTVCLLRFAKWRPKVQHHLVQVKGLRVMPNSLYFPGVDCLLRMLGTK